MTRPERLPIYVISIPRARQRLEALVKSAETLNLDLRPVEGVDGKQVPKDEWAGFSRAFFALRTGRSPLPGEYGCYRSHIRALSAFLESGAPFAAIVEDDVAFNPQFEARALAIIDAMPADAIVKVANHRTSVFRQKFVTALGDRVGRCGFGPQGSSACYLVSRAGAEQFVRAAGDMSQPFDKALECAWTYGTQVYVTKEDFLTYGSPVTLVGTVQQYRSTKFFMPLRTPAFALRLYDHIARYLYSLGGMPRKGTGHR